MTVFRVLGDLQVRIAGTELDLGPPKQRAVLTALVVDAGQLVPIDTLVDRVWNDDPPAEARNALYAHIMRIRRMLARGAQLAGSSWQLVHRAGGYLLEVDRDLVDLHRFRRLVDQARDGDCPLDTRAAWLSEALALGGGTPLSGLSGAWAERVREGLRLQRIEAMVAWARTELRMGHNDAVGARVSGWLSEFPLVEPLAAASMRALYAAGRSAEALDLYAITRQRLVDELGVEPGSELRQLHQEILRGDLDPAPPKSDPPAPRPVPIRTPQQAVAGPAQLPLDAYGFAGRTDELDRLHTFMKIASTQPTAMAISAVSGTAGAGKSTLAVHWAHQVADQFPDGQLYVNLRGFDPVESPLHPAEAVCRFLDALGVARHRVPTELDAQSALLRSMLAGKKALMLLDNARDAEQVRPLLPGSPGCLVLVTSRHRLSSLVVAEGAYPLALNLLSLADARQLLANRLGTDRVIDEPHAADDLITMCARLPLALTIVAAHAAAQPALSLAALVDQLRNVTDSLDGFDGGDDVTNLRVVFSWSYRALSPAAASLFRLLGLHTAQDIAIPAAASLAGLPPAQVRTLLAELARAHLLAEHVAGRYAFHDLLRAFARELARDTDHEADRRRAVHRLLDHYLHTAERATLLLYPQREAITLTAYQIGVLPERVETDNKALAWFTVERAGLLAATEQAAEAGFETHAWQLAWALTTVLDRQGYWQDLAAVQLIALDAAGSTNQPGQVHAHRGLARAYTRLGRYDDAYHHFQQGLELSSQLGDPVGEGNAHLNLGWVREHQNRYREALTHGLHALAVFQSAQHQSGQARALNAIGWDHTMLGEHRQALTFCEQALDLHRELRNRHGEANTWDSLGHAHHQLRDYQRAGECYRRAVELFRQIGDRYEEAQTLVRTGDVFEDAGAADAARAAWQAALGILEELDHIDATRIRAKLHSAR